MVFFFRCGFRAFGRFIAYGCFGGFGRLAFRYGSFTLVIFKHVGFGSGSGFGFGSCRVGVYAVINREFIEFKLRVIFFAAGFQNKGAAFFVYGNDRTDDAAYRGYDKPGFYVALFRFLFGLFLSFFISKKRKHYPTDDEHAEND